MKGTKDAVSAWNNVPNESRLKILNNVWCGKCRRERSISHAIAQIIDYEFMIKGDCVVCGNKIVRHVKSKPMVAKNKGDVDVFNKAARTKLLQSLASYPKSGKMHQLILNLEPLNMQSCGIWEFNEEDLFPDEITAQDREIYGEIITLGSRPCWEMEQVLPDHVMGANEYSDPITDGVEILESDGFDAGIKHFKGLIRKDARCIDAYAHIGNAYLNLNGKRAADRAKSYYKQGVAIGLASIGSRIYDVFPWGLLDNRPFLRCLHGFGLSVLEQGKIDEALAVFRQILLLNPMDNQGVRFVIADLLQGKWPTLN